jgi:hypothetical protein
MSNRGAMVADTSASRNEQVAGAFAEGERIADLIRALGGPARVAAALNMKPDAVIMWYAPSRRGPASIPARHHAALWRLAQARGVPWTPPGFEGVRLLPVDTPHADDGSVTAAPSGRECSVNLGDAA